MNANKKWYKKVLQISGLPYIVVPFCFENGNEMDTGNYDDNLFVFFFFLPYSA